MTTMGAFFKKDSLRLIRSGVIFSCMVMSPTHTRQSPVLSKMTAQLAVAKFLIVSEVKLMLFAGRVFFKNVPFCK